MLTSELKKLKEYLEGTRSSIDKNALLKELRKLDESDVKALFESLSAPLENCPVCNRPMRK